MVGAGSAQKLKQ